MKSPKNVILKSIKLSLKATDIKSGGGEHLSLTILLPYHTVSNE